MKSPGVSPHSLSATLFLVAAALVAPAVAATAMDALPVTPVVPETMVAPRKPAQAARAGAPIGAPTEKLKKYDRDGDGLLDAAEFAAAQRALRAEAGVAAPGNAAEVATALRRRVFEQFDQNGDGRLDDAERTAAQTAVANGSLIRSPELREEVLERFDRDENNRLDPDERTAMVAFFRELRGAAPVAAGGGAMAGGAGEPVMAGGAALSKAELKAEAKAAAKAEAKLEKKGLVTTAPALPAVPDVEAMVNPNPNANATTGETVSAPTKKEKVAKELTKRRQASVEAAARVGEKP